MSEPKRTKYLSRKEEKYFEALGNFGTVKAAAKFLGIAPSTLYNWLWNLRKRYRKKRGWINAVLSQVQRGGCLSDLLTERNQMAAPEDEDELF